jgi:poly(3-hydroxybutyrate) depolymerase
MTRRILVALACAAVLAATGCGGGGSDPPAPPTCPTGALASGAADATFAVAGWPDRDYDLVLPASHVCGQPIAVIVALHGGGSNKEGMRKLSCLDGDLASAECLHRVANAAGMAVVFANGTDAVGGTLVDPNGVRTWNAGGGSNGYICVSGAACTAGIDDVGYIRALLADVATRTAIDPKRIFFTGMSNGAAMSQRLACQAADLVAAIAPVAGENQFALAGCTPSRPVAVLDIHGTSDACWPYPGGNGGCLQGRALRVGRLDARRLGGAQRLRPDADRDHARADSRRQRRHERRPLRLHGVHGRRRARAPRGRRQRSLLAARLRLRERRGRRRRHESPARDRPGDRRLLRCARSLKRARERWRARARLRASPYPRRLRTTLAAAP